MEWGCEWSSLWGGPKPQLEDAGQVAVERFPCRTQCQTTLMAFSRALADRFQYLENFITFVQPQFVLDFENQSGVWLDLIGGYLGVPRGTRDEDYYRRVLGAYAQIVYPARRTIPGLIAALEALAEEGRVSYAPTYPKGFIITVAGASIGSQLSRDVRAIIELGRPATYNAFNIEETQNPFLWTDGTGELPVSSEWWSDATGELPGGGEWSSAASI